MAGMDNPLLRSQKRKTSQDQISSRERQLIHARRRADRKREIGFQQLREQQALQIEQEAKPKVIDMECHSSAMREEQRSDTISQANVESAEIIPLPTVQIEAAVHQRQAHCVSWTDIGRYGPSWLTVERRDCTRLVAGWEEMSLSEKRKMEGRDWNNFVEGNVKNRVSQMNLEARERTRETREECLAVNMVRGWSGKSV